MTRQNGHGTRLSAHDNDQEYPINDNNNDNKDSNDNDDAPPTFLLTMPPPLSTSLPTRTNGGFRQLIRPQQQQHYHHPQQQQHPPDSTTILLSSSVPPRRRLSAWEGCETTPMTTRPHFVFDSSLGASRIGSSATAATTTSSADHSPILPLQRHRRLRSKSLGTPTDRPFHPPAAAAFQPNGTSWVWEDNVTLHSAWYHSHYPQPEYHHDDHHHVHSIPSPSECFNNEGEASITTGVTSPVTKVTSTPNISSPTMVSSSLSSVVSTVSPSHRTHTTPLKQQSLDEIKNDNTTHNHDVESKQQEPTLSLQLDNGSNPIWICILYGMINATIVTPVLMSFASIIYRDNAFAPYMPVLVRLTMVSGIVHQLCFSTFSSLPFAVGQVQDAGLIFLSGMASYLVQVCRQQQQPSGRNHNSITEEDQAMLATVVVGLSLCTALLGLGLVVIGRLRLAQYVQMLPTR